MGANYKRVPPDAFSVVAEVRAKPGREAELRAAALPLITFIRSDPQNPVYYLQEDREALGHFVFYEVFANERDFEAHNNMKYVRDWLARLPELADRGVRVTRLQILTDMYR